MRIALVFPGDSNSPTTRSGTPHGLARGLSAHGAEVLHIRAEPGLVVRLGAESLLTALQIPRTAADGPRDVLRRSHSAALLRPELGWLQARSVRRHLRGALDTAGVVQVGTGLAVPGGLPTVTHDDMTVIQAVEYGYPQWRLMSKRAINARIAVQRSAYERAVACCVTSDWARQSLVTDYGVPASKVHVVGVGRNLDITAPPDRDWSRPRFLFIGKDWERKNGPAILRAFERLRNHIPEATLDLVGGHPPIEHRGVSGHGLLRISHAEERRRLSQLLSHATCFVMPSLFEPFGIVFAEASAAGIPSIGTTMGGCADLLEGCGRVVDPYDEGALLAAMLELSEPAVAERAGRLARERADALTWPAVGGRILRALTGAPPCPIP